MNGRNRLLTLASCLGALLLMQPLARADVEVWYNGGGSYSDQYVLSPYILSSSPIPGSSNPYPSSTLALSCDDFATELQSPWYASQSDLQTAISTGFTNQKFHAPVTGPDHVTYSVEAQYLAAAILGTDIFQNYLAWDAAGEPTGKPLDQQYSYALWGIFDPTALSAAYAPASATTLAESTLSQVATALNTHNTAFLDSISDVQIWTPTTDPKYGFVNSQEFITAGTSTINIAVPAPEGSSLIFLAFDLLVLFAGAFLVRKYAHLN